MIIKRTKQALITALLIAAPLGFWLAADKVASTVNQDLAIAPQFSLPFHLVDGFLLIEGNVNGKNGRFMFDTGTPFAFFLNNHYLPLAKDSYIGQGFAGSGQQLTLYSQSKPVTLGLGGQLQIINLAAVPHADFGFIEEGISENYLGFIGHGYNKDHLFVLNYDKQTIEFYPLVSEQTTWYKDKIITTLNFTSKGDGKMPEVEFLIGGQPIIAVFDTGNQGTINLTEATKAKLENEGYLAVSHDDQWYGAYKPYLSCSVKKIRYKNRILADINNLELKIGPENKMVMGYQFLKNYVSAWNYQNKTITLLAQ
ncbi:MAG: hypothetical protein NTV43_08250 [Methylococcales bacterium]|nr:hypothetical protein [Methylococcales bacterium]